MENVMRGSAEERWRNEAYLTKRLALSAGVEERVQGPGSDCPTPCTIYAREEGPKQWSTAIEEARYFVREYA